MKALSWLKVKVAAAALAAPALVDGGQGMGLARLMAQEEAKPSGARRIEFTTGGFTDVTVAILNQGGSAVRRLVAGALGKNAPPPLQKDTTAQVFSWDLKDDGGKGSPRGTTACGLGSSCRQSRRDTSDARAERSRT